MDTTKNIMLRPTLETFAAQAQVFASAWALMGGPFDSGDGLELAETERGILLDMARRMQEENEALRAQAQTCGAGAGCCAQAARIAELEAQLESLGVGGAAPDGWQLVPAEPTKEMVIEAYAAQGEATSSTCKEIYRAMLAAAPQPAVQAGWCDGCSPDNCGGCATSAAPVPAVQQDAERYRFLRDGEWRDTELEPFIRLQRNSLWDSKIDAAIAAQKGDKT